MATLPEAVRTGRGWSIAMIAGLGMAAIWLFLAGVIGAIKVNSDEESVAAGAGGDLSVDDSGDFLAPEGEEDGGDAGAAPATTAPAGQEGTESSAPEPGGSDPIPSGDDGDGDGGDGGSGTSSPSTTAASTTTAPAEEEPTGDSTGVSDTTIKVGVHAPQSIGGAPLDLAEDPIKGIKGYVEFINQNGGINGRMIELDIQDDRYETSGGADAGRRLIENGNFIISGTLGVDQINVVANEARKAGVPYHAAGGGEEDFARLGVHQVGTSYDTHVIQLARFLSVDGKYKGKKVGISALNSELIKPAVRIFKAEAQRVGVEVVETVYVEKPTDQSSYTAEIQKLKDAGTEVFVPLQDPVTTGRMVNECITALCAWTYTFSNFAHDGDQALPLMGGEWGRQSVKGLSAACYYLHENAYDPNQCARMDKAHEQWVQVYSEEDWQENGQGGAFGYQIISMLKEALRRPGADLTRERYLAAIRSYDGYSDLVYSPITFKGKEVFSHGAEKMVVYQAQTDDTYKQIVPGFVEY